MPTLEDYARLAPFTIDELVDAANSVLRDRPRLQVQKRTVRYYVSEGILPPPGGSPKFARYDLEHLTRLVNARRLLDEGNTLDEVRRNLTGSVVAESAPFEPERKASYQMPKKPSPPRQRVSAGAYIRIRLGPDISLEAPAEMEEREALFQAHRRIEEILQDTT